MSSVFIFVKIKSDFVSLALIFIYYFFSFLLKSLRCYYLMISSHCAKEITKRQATFLQVIFIYFLFSGDEKSGIEERYFCDRNERQKKRRYSFMMMKNYEMVVGGKIT